MEHTEWVRCPICGNKTRLQIRADTELKNFPLYCPKCRQESIIKALLANPGVKPLFHSDRGYQYTSKTFRQKIVDAGMTQSRKLLQKALP